MTPYMLSNQQLEEVFGSLKNPRSLWIFGIVSIFLCYVNAILFLRRFQPFGIYVSMFLEVFKTVARVFFFFFIFIIAFAVVFFVLFKEQVRNYKEKQYHIFIVELGPQFVSSVS